MWGLDFGLGWFGLLMAFLFWGGLLAIALWLVNLLFPAVRLHRDESVNSNQEVRDF
jgi:hypothetical protein